MTRLILCSRWFWTVLIKSDSHRSELKRWTFGSLQQLLVARNWKKLKQTWSLSELGNLKLDVACTMLIVMEFHVRINHPRGKAKRAQNKVQFELLLAGKPIEESTWVQGI
jgi:hypothetical protein